MIAHDSSSFEVCLTSCDILLVASSLTQFKEIIFINFSIISSVESIGSVCCLTNNSASYLEYISSIQQIFFPII
jgi:hypothetical protein